MKPESAAGISLLAVVGLTVLVSLLVFGLASVASGPPKATVATRLTAPLPPAVAATQILRLSPRLRRPRRQRRVSEEEQYSRAQSVEVWAEADSRRYVLPGAPGYGTSPDGLYMSLEDAQRLGYRRRRHL